MKNFGGFDTYEEYLFNEMKINREHIIEFRRAFSELSLKFSTLIAILRDKQILKIDIEDFKMYEEKVKKLLEEEK